MNWVAINCVPLFAWHEQESHLQRIRVSEYCQQKMDIFLSMLNLLKYSTQIINLILEQLYKKRKF